MDCLSPPMFDVSNIDTWKFRMSMYLKTLGLHVFLAATKKCYLGNRNHIGANAQALEALRSTLNKEYLMLVSNCDSALQCGTRWLPPSYKRQLLWRMNLVENPINNATWSKGMTPLRCGLSHDVRVMVPWGGCVPRLKRTIWMHHFQGEFGGRSTLFWRHGELPLLVW